MLFTCRDTWLSVATVAKTVSEQKAFEDFIRRVRAGDEQAAEELVQLYEPLVRRELRIKMTDRRISQLFDTGTQNVRASKGRFNLGRGG